MADGSTDVGIKKYLLLPELHILHKELRVLRPSQV